MFDLNEILNGYAAAQLKSGDATMRTKSTRERMRALVNEALNHLEALEKFCSRNDAADALNAAAADLLELIQIIDEMK